MNGEPRPTEETEDRLHALTAADWLAHEHRVVERLFDRIDDSQEDAARANASLLMRELSVFLAVEETVLFPRLREPDCSQLARVYVEENIDDHQVIRRHLEELADLRQIPSGKLVGLMAPLRDTVNHIISEEESGLIHLTEYCLDATAQTDLGIEMQRKYRELSASAR